MDLADLMWEMGLDGDEFQYVMEDMEALGTVVTCVTDDHLTRVGGLVPDSGQEAK